MASYAQGACQPCYHSQQQQYHHHQPRWSLNDLSTELLALIFEQVRYSPSGHALWSLSDDFVTTDYSLG